jgi:hypothetical protein
MRYDVGFRKGLASGVSNRTPVDLMQFADFDRDDRPTEFLLQVATLSGSI